MYQEKAKLLPPDCGLDSGLNIIAYGKNAEIGQFPWMTVLGYNVNGTIHYFCGGTLISDKYILTAAHCTKVGSHIPTIARLGEWNISSDVDCVGLKGRDLYCATPVVDVEIEHIISHDGFGDSTLPSFQNDIALLRLKNEVKYTEFISSICLGPDIYQFSGTRYIISGWGLTEKNPDILSPVLQFTEISYYDFNTCDNIAPGQYRPLAKTQFCAGGDAETSCKGDSGGPLTYVYPLDGRIFQKEIISLSTSLGDSLECETEGRPNIFTEVSAYILWILDNIKK
ncbi:phenoloxidase-activating factor 3-like [Arctopsyche grandis]|uniref:phenoloxidase-activating factor 3-like n=1 Tax=Arctopsyche grandis TaxID=121162 RepID=UPI00406D9130